MAAAEHIDVRARRVLGLSCGVGQARRATAASTCAGSRPRPVRRSTGRSPGRAGRRGCPAVRGAAGPAASASSRRAVAIAMNSSWPPPMVPNMRVRRHQHLGALFARRRTLGLDDFDQRGLPRGRQESAVSASSELAHARRGLRPSAARPPSARARASPARRGADRSCGRRRSPPHPTAHAAPTSPA